MSTAEPPRAETTYDPSTDLGPALDEVAAATDRLLATVDRLTDDDVRAPSGLPGWTRAHVLTHLARNADALGNLAWWARTGEEHAMYPGGQSARDEAIEAGAGRHQGDLRLDLNESSERLLEQFADFPVDGLTREVRSSRGGAWLGWELPWMRLREVEIHHVDLVAGYARDDWPETFVTRTLDQLAPQILARGESPVRELRDGSASWALGSDGPVLEGGRAALLAWLLGRSAGDGLSPQPPGEMPVAPRWS